MQSSAGSYAGARRLNARALSRSKAANHLARRAEKTDLPEVLLHHHPPALEARWARAHHLCDHVIPTDLRAGWRVRLGTARRSTRRKRRSRAERTARAAHAGDAAAHLSRNRLSAETSETAI